MDKERKKCKSPMSQFYTYEDEVPSGIRVSTDGDCSECECEGSSACEENGPCLITDS